MATISKRITPYGTAYQVRVRVKGHPTQTKTFNKSSDAKHWAQQTESGIKNGLYFTKHSSTKYTFAEMVDRYQATILLRKANNRKFYINQLHQLEWWKARLGAFLLSKVNAAKIAETRDHLLARDGIKEATVNRYLAALSHVYTIASREWEWIDENPVSKVNRCKEPRGRTRFLQIDEQRKLLEVCKTSSNPHLYLAVLMALSTGARQMEILGLEWRHVDLERAQITLEFTKNGEQRSLPLTPTILAMLNERKLVSLAKCDYVFPNKFHTQPARVHVAFQKAISEIGIKDFRFHDLRHTAASYLAMSGASLAEIAEILGHRTLQMVKRYTHISTTHSRKVIERMDQEFLRISL